MDRMGPADGCNGFKAAGTQAKDTKVCQILEANTKDIEGAKIEHNLFCASVHFRWVKEEVTL
jgi:trehalose 6-phosphate phosphatase